jgi:hypothetical protein
MSLYREPTPPPATGPGAPFRPGPIPREQENWLDAIAEWAYPTFQNIGATLVEIAGLLRTPPSAANPLLRVIGTPGVAPRPPAAVATSSFAVDVLDVGPDDGLVLQAGQGALATAPFTVPAVGLLWIVVTLSTPNAVLSLSRDAGRHFDAALNRGQPLVAGADYGFTPMVHPGDQVDLAPTIQAAVSSLRVAYVPSL